MKPLFLAVLISIVGTALFADADLLVTPIISGGTTFVAGDRRFVRFSVRNNGPDQAKEVVVTTNATGGVATGPCATGCPFNGPLPVGEQSVLLDMRFPDTPGDVIITASATSSTPDPNPGNNSASMTIHVSPDPDVLISLNPPFKTDLALPFPLTINVNNASAVAAHDVDVTVDFRPDVTVKTLPSGCTNPSAGRVVCHSDTVVRLEALPFVVTLFGPPSLGDGRIVFTATATAREPDFYPPSNSFQASTLLNVTYYVTTMADSGAGSLRQAILDANTATGSPLTIAFRIGEQSTTPWKTIRVTSPLPAITAPGVRIDGGTQAGFFGDANPDGPEIEISGGGTIDGDGLLIATCNSEVANLAIGGFLRNGISVTKPVNPGCVGYYTTNLHHLFLGSDPTGSAARPNARGIGTSVPNGNEFNSAGMPTTIHDCLISGNTFSGIFGLSGRLSIASNRIGVKAHADEPLPNGASGVFIGAGGYGSDVGPDVFSAFGNATSNGNVIAFNGETGVAIAAGVKDVAVRNNRIWSNRLLGIDIGLDGPTASAPAGFGDAVTSPVLTNAQYDPVSNKTIIEGDIPAAPVSDITSFTINVYASDAADPSGFGEGQRSLGRTTISTPGLHFLFEAAGDLTGQWITATNTRQHYVGWAKPAPEGIDQGFLTQTSEFSRGVPVQ